MKKVEIKKHMTEKTKGFKKVFQITDNKKKKNLKRQQTTNK